MSIFKATPVKFAPTKFPNRPTVIPPYRPGVIVSEYIKQPPHQDKWVIRINWSAVEE